MTDPTAKQHAPAPPEPRRAWSRPEVRPVGTVGEVLKAGTNKLTVVGDPAEPGKVPGPDL